MEMLRTFVILIDEGTHTEACLSMGLKLDVAVLEVIHHELMLIVEIVQILRR
jgi:hypothetical protein